MAKKKGSQENSTDSQNSSTTEVSGFTFFPVDRKVPHTIYHSLMNLPPKDSQGAESIAERFKRKKSQKNKNSSSSANDTTTGLESTLGVLYLDQTRLTPLDTVIGEHIYTLSLAPQETVVLTQKSWTKQKMSLEDALTNENESNLENSSTFSSDLSENLQHSTQETDSKSATATISGGYGPVNGSVSGTMSSTSGVQDTRGTSTRVAQQGTSRAATKARMEHKTTFTVASESFSSSGSKKTIRNMNTAHSMMIKYYKIFQKYEVNVERVGRRLCWSPFIRKPSLGLSNRAVARKAEIERYLDPANFDLKIEGLPGSKTVESLPVKAENGVWGFSDDLKTTIKVDDGFQLVELKVVYVSTPTDSWAGHPREHVNPLNGATGVFDVYWHVGMSDWFYLNNKYKGRIPNSTDTLWIKTVATIAPNSQMQSDYQERLNKARAAELEKRTKEVAERAAKDDEETVYFDPSTELMRRLITSFLNPDEYNDAHEVARWHEIFEWENLSYTLYPSWWDRDEDSGLSKETNFLTASWAKLFVPIRPGFEVEALRAIQKSTEERVDYKKVMHRIGAKADATDDYTPEVLGTFIEYMPTDGTYAEPVIGLNLACDRYLLKDINLSQKERAAQLKALNSPTQNTDDEDTDTDEDEDEEPDL